MVNEIRAGGRHEARLIAFAPALSGRFHEQFGQFAGTPPVQGCASSAVDENFTAAFGLAMSALLARAARRVGSGAEKAGAQPA
ncbi:hypothetical protein [Roseateles oligotrophus]|uniref:Uncharacterized protein n=1 Tax=Roseateles oligotrophus TaxID=1769250 RepID=A0ABT2YB94_9BURK|nr:hypothetical protein [Roseateles oligotrophus]MCV2367566.1 hypothetical protein [Roseateles oligotrophus]